LNRGVSSYYLRVGYDKIPIINIKDVVSGTIRTDTVERAPVRLTHGSSDNWVEPGDVILTIKGSVFKAALVGGNAKGYLISSNLIAFSLNEQILPGIAVAYLNSPVGQAELNSKATGSFQKSLNMKSLLDIQIPVPPLSEQKKLAEYFELASQYEALVGTELELRKRLKEQILFEKITR
jgi:type I restriction enzyme M protein